MKTKLIMQGEIAMWTVEGGYAAPDVDIGRESLTTAIAEFTGLEKLDERGAVSGTWRMTLERIDAVDS